jgi:hypothetical protein
MASVPFLNLIQNHQFLLANRSEEPPPPLISGKFCLQIQETLPGRWNAYQPPAAIINPVISKITHHFHCGILKNALKSIVMIVLFFVAIRLLLSHLNFKVKCRHVKLVNKVAYLLKAKAFDCRCGSWLPLPSYAQASGRPGSLRLIVQLSHWAGQVLITSMPSCRSLRDAWLSFFMSPARNA